MKSLAKYLGLGICLICLSSSVFAAASSSVQLDTAIPPPDGMLTPDQIPPLFLPKSATTGANPVAAPAPAAAPSDTPAPVAN